MVEAAQYSGHTVNDEQVARDALYKRALSGFEGDRHAFMCAEDTDADNRIGPTEISMRELPDFLKPKRTRHIHAVYVEPDQRGYGVGKAL